MTITNITKGTSKGGKLYVMQKSERGFRIIVQQHNYKLGRMHTSWAVCPIGDYDFKNTSCWYDEATVRSAFTKKTKH